MLEIVPPRKPRGLLRTRIDRVVDLQLKRTGLPLP